MTEPRFDSKHDARYQRGYEPGEPAAAGTSAPTGPFAPTSEDQPVASADSPEIGSVALLAPADGAPDADALLDRFEPRNPFIIALWIIGPVLMIGGLILQVRSFLGSLFGMDRGFTGDQLPFELIAQQIAFNLAPTMISTGMATVVGLLFYQAVRWRSRSTRR